MPSTSNDRAVFLATSESWPLTESDRILAAALESRGVRVTDGPWDMITAADATAPGGPLVCVRSTWDYFKRADEFRRWIEAFADHPHRLWNPPATLLWNFDKIYLLELEARGVPIPVTHWLEGPAIDGLPARLAEAGWDRAVVKPRVSGGAYGTHLVTRTTVLDGDERALLRKCGAMLQEFVPEVPAEGEVSLMYFDGEFSHSVRKYVAAGEFRVQPQFGGSFERVEVSPALRQFGADVLRIAGRPWLYARVDVVERASGPLLMELEILEPELFFSVAPERAPVLADALIARFA